MTVRELIEVLGQFPQDATVRGWWEGYEAPITEIALSRDGLVYVVEDALSGPAFGVIERVVEIVDREEDA